MRPCVQVATPLIYYKLRTLDGALIQGGRVIANGERGNFWGDNAGSR